MCESETNYDKVSLTMQFHKSARGECSYYELAQLIEFCVYQVSQNRS